MLIQKQLLEKLIELASDSAEYLNEKWITVHPHGSDSKGTHVKVEDGETNKEAIDRKFGDGKAKDIKKPKEGDTFTDEYGKKQYVLWEGEADDNKIHYASDPEAPFGNVMSFADYKELITNPEKVLARKKKSIKDFEDRAKAKMNK